jgi:CheY-like chemotaxis protein
VVDAQHILVVDGDAGRRTACVAVLSAMGAGAEACATPVEAMGHLVRRVPPVVTALVVAGDLAGMGPVLLIRAARTLPGRTGLPVVVVGGDGGQELPARCTHIATAGTSALGEALTALTAPAAAAAPVAPRVLVVDDHEINRVVLAKAVEARGIQVDVAVDGIDALARAGRQRYALVFMDVEMPRMDGLEATRALRRLEQGRGRRTPIIACTSRNQGGDRETGLAAGMDDYLVKPMTMEQIEAQLERWLGPPSAAAPAPAPAASSPVPDLPLVDATVLDRIKSYGPEVLANTAGAFLVEVDGRIAELERLLAAGDCTGLHHQAHGLKGVAGSLGAKRLWQALAAIETVARAGDCPGARALLGDLPSLVRATAAAMREVMG